MTPGSLYSSKKYIEYQPGALNVIISVPHGGTMKPSSIPNRDAGYILDGKVVYDHNSDKKDNENCQVTSKGDVNTIYLSEKLCQELEELTGSRPHVIINHLSRVKLDANRDIEVATFKVPDAEEAWRAYHNFIDIAKSSITGAGLFLDIHGQSHPEGLVELGYALTQKQLDSKVYHPKNTTVAHLSLDKDINIQELIFGENSFGGLLEKEGYKSIPSPTSPCVNGMNYYSGGYNVRRHGSSQGGRIDGIQIETPRAFRQPQQIPKYAKALAKVVHNYLELYYC